MRKPRKSRFDPDAMPMNRMLVLFASFLWCAVSAHADEVATLKAGVFDPPRPAPDFTLQGSDGSTLKLSTYRGKVVLLGFGFTSCAAVCPITLGTLAQVQKKLGEQARDLQVIYITVDPERDDAAQLKRYLGSFNPAFVGGTGTDAQLAAVRKDFGIAAEKVAGPDGSYTHSSFIYLIDREGRLRALMPFGHVADDFVHDVRILMAAP
jgi:protein SCO1